VPDQDAGEDAPSCDPLGDAIEALFPLAAFAGVAQVLDLPEDPKILAWLRSWLLPEFRCFLGSGSGKRLSREEKIERAEKLHDAAVALDALLGPGGVWSWLPLEFWDSNLETDQFTDTLRIFAREVETQIQRLRCSQGQGGRPRKDDARQLGADLIRVFATISRKRPKDLDFKKFKRFAGAVFRCLRTRVPAVAGQIPATPRALHDMLKDVWKFEVDQENEKPPLVKSE
jgi:hypothetical protein